LNGSKILIYQIQPGFIQPKVFLIKAEYNYYPRALVKVPGKIHLVKIFKLQKRSKRLKITLILAIAAVAANIALIWYAKKYNKAKTDETSDPENGSYAISQGYLNTPEARRLRKSAAAELGLSIKQLDRIPVKEIKQLSKEQKLIN
jgi:hypothetical protein